MKKHRILLTGGNGFLGSSVLRGLVKEEADVILLVRRSSNLFRIEDLLDKVRVHHLEAIDLEEIFFNAGVRTVVHCATNYGRDQLDPSDILEANLLLPLRLLQIGRKSGVSCFVNTDTVLDKRVNTYSLSKHQFEDWLQFFSKDMACVNVALEHFYGPFDDRSKFVSYVVHSLMDGAAGLDLTKGEQKRDFIYIDDAVDAFLRILRRSKDLGAGFHHYEIGSGVTTEIREMVRLADRLAGVGKTKLNFGALPYREKEVMESRVDVAELKRLGWSPSVSLEEGLRRTIDQERRRKTP